MIRDVKEYLEIKNRPDAIIRSDELGLDIINEHWLKEDTNEYKYLKDKYLICEDNLINFDALKEINETVNKILYNVSNTEVNNTVPAFNKLKSVLRNKEYQHEYLFSGAVYIPLTASFKHIDPFILNKIQQELLQLGFSKDDDFMQVFKWVVLEVCISNYSMLASSESLISITEKTSLELMYDLLVYYGSYTTLHASGLFISNYILNKHNKEKIKDLLNKSFNRIKSILKIEKVSFEYNKNEIIVKISDTYTREQLMINLELNNYPLYNYFTHYLGNYSSYLVNKFIKFYKNNSIDFEYLFKLKDTSGYSVFHNLISLKDLRKIKLNKFNLTDERLYKELSNLYIDNYTVYSNNSVNKLNLNSLCLITFGIVENFPDLELDFYDLILDYEYENDFVNEYYITKKINNDNKLYDYVKTLKEYKNKGINIFQDKVLCQKLLELIYYHVEYELEVSFIESIRYKLAKPNTNMVYVPKLIQKFEL